MSFTLTETLRQIDPYVLLDDGVTVAIVKHRLERVDPNDLSEYAIGVDPVGRLLIYRLDMRGRLIRPAAFVERKEDPADPVAPTRRNTPHFGYSLPGYA